MNAERQTWDRPLRYRLRLRGCLDQAWEDWFPGFQLRSDGAAVTTLEGWVPDQAALHGILLKIRELGLPLLLVLCLEFDDRSLDNI